MRYFVRHELGTVSYSTTRLSRAFDTAEQKSTGSDWAYVVENRHGEILGRFEYGRQVWDSLDGRVD